jgi:transcriptional regulator with XRE-family HTH domain
VSGRSEVEGHFLTPGEGSRSHAVGTPRIGRRLSAARRRRGLEVEDVERALRIRSRYLRALEAERFEDLPGEAYARAFLREYADYLGVDADPLVQALDERLGLSFEAEPEPTDLGPERSFWVYADRVSRHFPARMPVVAIALAILSFVLLSWRLGDEPAPPAFDGVTEDTVHAPVTSRAIPAIPAIPATHSRRPPRRVAPAPPRLARLVLAPTSGDCWLLVREGSADGRILYEGTLQPGRSLRFVRKQLWIRTGAPWNLAVRLNGRVVGGLPTRPGNVIATTAGLHPA